MSSFKIGDRVTLRDDERNRGGYQNNYPLDLIGKSGEVVLLDDDLLHVRFDGTEHVLGGIFDWRFDAEAPAGIRVTLPDNGTTRQYAKEANSKVLPPESQRVLKAAASGDEVDLRAFQKAVTQALSSAATRKGQSMARRDLTRKIRHLAYWADAILDDHLDGVPAFDSKEARSRLVVKLRGENSDLARGLESATAEIQDLVATIEADRAQWQSEVETLRARVEAKSERAASLHHELTRANERVEEFRQRNHDLVRGLNRSISIASFARSLLDEIGRAKVEGFVEGLDYQS